MSADFSVLAASEISSDNAPETLQSERTYLLTLLPGGGRQVLKIEPPATRLAIVSQSGDLAVRCGDGIRNYSCIPGKLLQIESDSSIPIEQFWGENPHEYTVRLRVKASILTNSSKD